VVPQQVGVEGFMAGLRGIGIEPTVESDVVTFSVDAGCGVHAGQAIRTGVGCDELAPWPALPPHWVHLPADVAFTTTNTSASVVPGFVRHSRGVEAWGNAADPAQAWVAHVRGLLSESVLPAAA
jgi:hypothetical protein